MDDGFDVSRIDEVIHGRLRLGVMSYLTSVEEADFVTLRTKLNTTDGNLSVQLRKLEEAGYVVIEKAFVDRKPVTRAKLTPQGRKAFKAYLQALTALIEPGLTTKKP